ncbi:MAG: hypothetical protein R2739_06015 [Chitinophagales bacterium]|nr:hypothetical protein [Bacteroidota bacterium]
MKSLLCTSVLCVCFLISSFAQDISFKQLLQLRTKTSNEVEQQLSSLDFIPYDADDIGNGRTISTFQNAILNNSTIQWIDLVTQGNATWNNRLSFQTQNIEKVKNYLSELKSLGYYFTIKKVVDKQIYEVYTNGINTIELITSQNRSAYQYDGKMYFNFAIYGTSEYNYAFAAENAKYAVPSIKSDELYANLVDLPIASK